ncbi:hypothetical protein TorRG33x02_338960 [Trema orientale]|uniref:Uncharacterized protein n=1 Tax=Trema orientale TaxID=63057 RepID=A0A2P5AWY0_TREOI|nr:hypothetical protein TorRG33x02_338960 [Trema orientale]
MVCEPKSTFKLALLGEPSGVTFGIRADPVHICVGLGRLPRAVIVVNVDPTHRGYMWVIKCGPPSEDARPLTRGDCTAPSPHRVCSGKIMGI